MAKSTNKPLSRSGLVAKILEEYFRGAQAVDAETDDLKKILADKEAALNKLHSQDAVITGLQHELETVRTQVKTLEEKLAIYTGLNNDFQQAGSGTITTVSGLSLPFTIKGTTVSIDSATIVSADIRTSNGVLHEIDNVFIPPAGR